MPTCSIVRQNRQQNGCNGVDQVLADAGLPVHRAHAVVHQLLPIGKDHAGTIAAQLDGERADADWFSFSRVCLRAAVFSMVLSCRQPAMAVAGTSAITMV